jgi:hypothetical protein
MQTICNRIESDKFPNTLKEVIYQSGQFECTKKNIENIKITNNSQCALEYKDILINAGQLYFENNHGNGNTWHQSNLEFLFEHLDHCFYK